MATLRELLRRTADIPGDSPTRDLEILLGYCLKQSRTWLYTWPETVIDGPLLDRFEALLARRQAGEPVAYIIGEREFWTLQLAVNESTLIPRPETETLVEWALELALPGDARVLDLGTGTGAIALALASERSAWQVTGVDESAEAVELARGNGQSNRLTGVDFIQSDWYGAVQSCRFHLIVGNPPYIAPDDQHLSQGDVRFEPAGALVSGESGFADLRAIIEGAPAQLLDQGWLLLEHGFTQGGEVRELLASTGFGSIASRTDLGGNERITGGCWRAD